MELDVGSFMSKPTIQQFDAFRKKDLIQIAEILKVSVVSSAPKQVVKAEVYAKLVEQGFLSADGEIEKSVCETAETDLTSQSDPLLLLKVKEVELQIKRQEHENRMLHLRELEMVHKEKERERAFTASPSVVTPVHASMPSPIQPAAVNLFDPSKYIKLVPPFRESEADAYFIAFERIAAKLNWPKDMWGLMLQCSLVGKAQEVCSALPIEESLNYDLVKAAVLRVYELVPEAYRQKFRNYTKSAKQTFVQFARDKRALLEKWCAASKTTTFEQFQELILLEDFKNCFSDNLVIYLNEQKVKSLSEAAVLADEYILTHKTVFSSAVGLNHGTSMFSGVQKPLMYTRSTKPMGRSAVEGKEESKNVENKRVCFYCLDPNHLIVDCKAWKNRNAASKPKSVANIVLEREFGVENFSDNSAFTPFVFEGSVSVSLDGTRNSISILRDTGSAQSFILESALPFSEVTYTGTDVLVRGIELNCVKVPLHTVFLTSDLVSGPVKIGVRSRLPVEGVSLILGNDLAGAKVFPHPIVAKTPVCDAELASRFPSVFSVCAVTRAQARKNEDVIDLSDTFLASPDSPSELRLSVVSSVGNADDEIPEKESSLTMGREQLGRAQKSDPSLTCCIEAVENKREGGSADGVRYFWDQGILMREWLSRKAKEAGLSPEYQIVLPVGYRKAVLKLSHDHPLSGHLGSTKTFMRVAKYFYWPGLRSAVSNHCRSCHVCQLAGKPNQTIRPAPLQPIPVMGEPFERLILDCVGPLPKSKAGFQYILTLMCAATRFPEAIPLRNIKAKTIVKELIKFCSTFGLPRVIQTDQGTNFKSKVFEQMLKGVSVNHVVSSAYHPQSQGALERFHQTLKSMMRAHCVEAGKDWADDLPLLLFAIRETVQESLGFSPAELIFGHTVRGPLKLLREELVLDNTPLVLVSEYVSSIRERLRRVCEMAKVNLAESQSEMKEHYDRKSVARSFQPGDSVLLLMSVPGSALQPRFSGPFRVTKKLSDTNYLICTPERRRKLRMVHVNMLKSYMQDESALIVKPSAAVVSAGANEVEQEFSVPCGYLSNSVILKELDSHLSYLAPNQRKDIVELIESHHSLFGDIPSQTIVLQHDIDVGNAQPIKQHPFRINPRKRELMKAEVEYLRQNNFASPSQSAWSSPCLLVPKADSSVRFCTDYRKVNAVTKPDSFPLPRMEDCIDRVGPAKFVTKLDLLKGYWQVPLTPRASEISAFVTPDDFMQYSVMAFGMRNAPSTFQRLMRIVLDGVQKCEAYLDDVVIYSSSWEEHLSSLREVLSRFCGASLTLNLAKCEFAKATVVYLGKRVGQGQVCPVDAKIASVMKFPVPVNKRELRRFLGMAGYYRGFCRNFASVVSPLTDLLSTARVFVWSPACEQAFQAAKDLLCNAPVLAAPEFARSFKLEVDASATGAGAVLLQESEFEVDHPVCYFSKKFTLCQRRYSTIEKEALALLLALQHFEVYLGGSSFPIVVYTDHNPLVFLARMSNSNQRLMRWALIIQEFNLDIRHKKGSQNIVADALSRVYGAEV